MNRNVHRPSTIRRPRLALALLAAASITPAVSAQSGPASAEWPHHGRDHAFTRYSPLDQIDASNFEQLEVAWRWKSADHDLREEPGTFRGSALMIGGRVYMATSLWQIAALDAATGEELWLYDPKSYESPRAYGATPRGLEYWTDGEAERIIFITSGKQLISLDLATGRPDPAFGKDGIVDLSDDRLGREEVFQRDISAGSPGIVIRDTFIVGSRIADAPATKQGLPPGHVRAYDVRTGEPKWRFHTIPREGEEFTETWHDDSWKWVGGANVWGAMAGDEELGYVYIPTTTPTGNLWGGHRPGANVYAESLLCLDAETGERVWHFQTVHHGIWDWDIASAPVLADVVIDGRLRKIVAQVSKTAFAYVFDRVTGEPIWPIEELPVPQTTVPGEWTAPTQPFPTKPAAFDLQGVTIDDLIDFTPELREEALEIADEFLLGPMFTPPIVGGEGGKTATLAVPGMAGGANHPGASLDPLTGVLYVQSRTQPTGVAVAPPDPARSEWRWVSRGGRVGSPQGLPLLKPPYQRITAIDLNTGEHAWMVPFGEGPTDHPAIRHLDLGPLGSRPSSGNREGGLLITRSLLITYVPNWPSWDARAASGSYLQAYDKATGKLLAEVETEATLHGVPMTYLHQGRQYIVVPAGGKVVSRTARSGPETAQLVAFALPAAPEPPPSRPNVVLMMSDDQGWGAVEYAQQLAPGDVFPGHPEIRTPNLRAMAEAGLQFHRMYSGGSVCSPTRASFVTGRAPRRNSVDFAYNDGLRNLELTLAELARTQGYTTGHFGKWHLGDLTRTLRDRNGGEFYSPPWNHGYDHVFASEQALPTFEPMKEDPLGPLPSKGNFHGGRYYTGPGMHADPDSPELRGDASAIIIRETLGFIDDAVAAERPFLAVVWLHAPHGPHRLNQATLDEFYTPEEQAQWTEYEARYYSSIVAMDREIGRLRTHLRELGIEGETLVAFTSDNGQSGSVRMEFESEGKGGLRGSKSDLWEGGVRVPGIVEWPGRIAPGETSTPMTTSDYLPTLLDIWGIRMPDARPLDGESMTEVLFGDRSAPRRGRIRWEDCGDPTTERGEDEDTDCDSRRTRMLQRVGGERSIIDDRYKLISETSGRKWELYDLIEDPREKTPVATSADVDSKPPKIQRIFQSLLDDITNWFEVEAARSRDGGDYDTRIASADGVDVLGDIGDETVPDDLSAARRTSVDRPELVVERQFATLEEDLVVESDGATASYDADDPPQGATVPAGTVVHSYLLHFAPTTAADFSGVEITFDDPILGVAASSANLAASDFLAFADPEFSASADRGLLVGESGSDGWEILADGTTIVVDVHAGVEGMDQLRILTRSALQRVEFEG